METRYFQLVGLQSKQTNSSHILAIMCKQSPMGINVSLEALSCDSSMAEESCSCTAAKHYVWTAAKSEATMPLRFVPY